MNIFPIIQPQATEETTELKLYKEVKWDYKNNIPIYRNGSPVIVTGKEAILVWAWKALHTPRFRYEIYTWAYGNEAESLIGQPYSQELKRSEGARCVRECLMINPYITDIDEINVSFIDDKMIIECRIETIYGEVNISV